jgi:predicted transcriptional regulator of viral defense system
MKFNDFRKSLDKPYFTFLDIHLRKLPVYPYQLSLWKKTGLLASFKRGIYYFPDQKSFLTREIIAFALYAPSYISLESALSTYGFIPEMVYSETSVTTKTTRRFSNEFGNFLYRHIHPKLFFGYKVIVSGSAKYLLAEPEKALLDYFYFKLAELQTIDDIKELRINTEEVRKNLDPKKFRKYRRVFGIKKLNYITDIFLQYADF